MVVASSVWPGKASGRWRHWPTASVSMSRTSCPTLAGTVVVGRGARRRTDRSSWRNPAGRACRSACAPPAPTTARSGMSQPSDVVSGVDRQRLDIGGALRDRLVAQHLHPWPRRVLGAEIVDGDDLAVVRCGAVDHRGGGDPAAEPGEAASPPARPGWASCTTGETPQRRWRSSRSSSRGRHGEQGDGEDAPTDHLVHTELVDVGDGDAGCLVRGQVITCRGRERRRRSTTGDRGHRPRRSP